MTPTTAPVAIATVFRKSPADFGGGAVALSELLGMGVTASPQWGHPAERRVVVYRCAG